MADEDTHFMTSRAQDRVSSWSPDGMQIAFVQAVHWIGSPIYVVNSDGTGLTLLLQSPPFGTFTRARSPIWSPDGQWMTFNARAYQKTGIFVMKADGSDVRQLTDHPEGGWVIAWIE